MEKTMDDGMFIYVYWMHQICLEHHPMPFRSWGLLGEHGEFGVSNLATTLYLLLKIDEVVYQQELSAVSKGSQAALQKHRLG